MDTVLALEIENPLIPAAYDIVWSAISLAVIAFAVAALVSVWRARAALTATQEAVWFLLVLFVPLLGSVAWFAAGRPVAKRVPEPR